MGSEGGLITTRALEAYWAGFTTWCLNRTDETPRRHQEVAGRLRALVVEIGERIVSLRHRGAAAGADRLFERVDRLEWQLEVASRRGVLTDDDRRRYDAALTCVRGLVPRPLAGAPQPLSTENTPPS